MISKALLFEGFFKLAKEQGLLRFFLRRHRIDIPSYAFISIIYKKQNSPTATTNFKTETQTCGNRTTPRLLRDLLNFSLQRVDSNQLEIINRKKRFSFITLLRINPFS